MRLNRVTITGADDKVKVQELYFLQKRFPFVEWGILFSHTKAGQPRYPSKEWVSSNLMGDLNLSAHFCGKYSREVLEDSNFYWVESMSIFNRVQLNYNFQNAQKYNIRNLKFNCKRMGDRAYILQYNQSNSLVLNKFLAGGRLPKNIHLLFDSSGGRGRTIEHIPTPFSNYTGYSGGISPENIETILTKIKNAEHDMSQVWIDMESGVRTDDSFDINKVELVLQKCESYIC